MRLGLFGAVYILRRYSLLSSIALGFDVLVLLTVVADLSEVVKLLSIFSL